MRVQSVQCHGASFLGGSIKRQPAVGTAVCKPDAIVGLVSLVESRTDAKTGLSFHYRSAYYTLAYQIGAAHGRMVRGHVFEKQRQGPLGLGIARANALQRAAAVRRGDDTTADWRDCDRCCLQNSAGWNADWPGRGYSQTEPKKAYTCANGSSEIQTLKSKTH